MHFIIDDHVTGMKDALILIKVKLSYNTEAMYLCSEKVKVFGVFLIMIIHQLASYLLGLMVCNKENRHYVHSSLVAHDLLD